MNAEVWQGILIPFVGTSLGAACVFVMKRAMSGRLQRALLGFASGVMVAASVWSLLIPSMEQSASMGKWSFVPAAVGFWIGIGFLLLLDRVTPHLHLNAEQSEGPRTRLGKTAMMVMAVVLHNIPEGMAVGVIYAGWVSGEGGVSLAGALALSVGIAIQNFPEGAIISMPLRAEGVPTGRAFAYGVLSGAVEPAAALLTVAAARIVVPVLPYLMSFAAGAMVYVCVNELIPYSRSEKSINIGVIGFGVGFLVMMVLDVMFS